MISDVLNMNMKFFFLRATAICGCFFILILYIFFLEVHACCHLFAHLFQKKELVGFLWGGCFVSGEFAEARIKRGPHICLRSKSPRILAPV